MENTAPTAKLREAYSVSYVPGASKMLPAFEVLAKYTNDDGLTTSKLWTLKPGMEIPENILPTIWAPPEPQSREKLHQAMEL